MKMLSHLILFCVCVFAALRIHTHTYMYSIHIDVFSCIELIIKFYLVRVCIISGWHSLLIFNLLTFLHGSSKIYMNCSIKFDIGKFPFNMEHWSESGSESSRNVNFRFAWNEKKTTTTAQKQKQQTSCRYLDRSPDTRENAISTIFGCLRQENMTFRCQIFNLAFRIFTVWDFRFLWHFFFFKLLLWSFWM